MYKTSDNVPSPSLLSRCGSSFKWQNLSNSTITSSTFKVEIDKNKTKHKQKPIQIWHWVSLKFFLFPFHQPHQQVVANIQFVFSFHFWNFSFLNNCNPNSITSSKYFFFFFYWSGFSYWSTFHLFFTYFSNSDFKKNDSPSIKYMYLRQTKCGMSLFSNTHCISLLFLFPLSKIV